MDSLGPVQIGSLNIEEINAALAQLVEWIDYLNGLRGTITVHAGVRVVDTAGHAIHGLGDATK